MAYFQHRVPDRVIRRAHGVLKAGQQAVTPSLRAAVDSLPAALRTVAGYHFGWLDRHGMPVESDGGKLLRPVLTLLSAKAVGAQNEDWVPGAVAVELVHGFSLLHDDIMDGDRVRRHRPSAWTVFGVPSAMLTGDALLALAMNVLAEAPRANEQSKLILSSVLMRLMNGQCADLEFEKRTSVAVAESVTMALDKTGALLGCACALGAQLSGGRSDQVARLRGFGEWSGLAFQLVDDLLGIAGDTDLLGKPVGADLVRLKKSPPIAFALSSGMPVGEELAGLCRLGRPLTLDEAQQAMRAVRAAGGLEWAEKEAGRYRTRALLKLRGCGLRPEPVMELESLSYLMTYRDR